MKEDLLEIVVVTYDSWSQAELELSTMIQLAHDWHDVSWCFVDNTPAAADARKLRDAMGPSENIRYIELNNPGFAAACNAAVRTSGAGWILLLNPDVFLSAENLREIVRRCQTSSPDHMMAISMRTGGSIHAGITLLPGWWFMDAGEERWNHILGPSGGAGLYPRRIFLELDGFWDPLFAWGEDADLAWRASRKGVRSELVDLRLEHQGGHSIAASRSRQRLKVEMLYRNRLAVAKRNLPPTRFAVFLALYGLAVVVLIPRNLKRRCAGASLLGYWSGLKWARRLEYLA